MRLMPVSTLGTTQPVTVGPGVALLEGFSINTDGNGEATVTVAYTPGSDNVISLFMKDALRRAEFVSRSGAAITVRVFKIGSRYNQASAPGAALVDLPSGVTEATSLQNTAGNSATANIDPSAAGAGGASKKGPEPDHTHLLNTFYRHGHTLTQTATELGSNAADLRAASETGLRIVVMYSK